MGKLGAAALNRKLTLAQRKRNALKAIRARWRKYYQAHPDKRKAKRKAA